MDILRERLIKIPLLLSATLVLLSQVSCSSSSSDPAVPVADVPFVNPIDAQTLRQALITSSTLADTTKYWECVTNTENRTLLYQLAADGRGSETDIAESNAQLGFDWQALSASSMSTQPDDTNTTLTFSDIQFSDRNSFRLSAAALGITLQCQRRGEESPPQTPPSGGNGNAIDYAGVVFPLTHAIERPFNPIPSPDDSHLGAEYKFADSEFFIIPLPVGAGGVINIWEPSGETVYLRADIYHPGTQPFSSVEFRHVPDSVDDEDSEVAGVAFFNDASLGVDLNQDGAVEGDDGEFIDVTGGTIQITRLGGSVSRISVNLTLANGVAVSGVYEGVVLLRSSDGV